MLSSVAIAVVIACAFHVQYIVGEDDCSEVGISTSCAEEFAKLGREYILRNYFESCRVMEDGIACMKRKMDNCKSDMTASYKGSKAKVDATCGPNSILRKTYTNNHDCINTMSNEYSLCEAEFQDLMSRPTSNEDQNTQMCCGLNQVTDCAVSLTTEKCGADAAKYPKEAMRVNMELPDMHCNEYKIEDMRCAPFIFEQSQISWKSIKETTERPAKSTAYSAHQGNSMMVSIGLLVISMSLH